MMFVLYKFLNFQKTRVGSSGLMTLEHDLTRIHGVPAHLRLRAQF
ncbi:MAG TPA: hypothetical protein VMV27_16440 [Candidatus Binataceae bacterium]|nr:hypothetical protein [Candidatus Binataceae bacterium]